MGRATAVLVAIVTTAPLAACQPRAEPYRFRGPLVGSVAAAPIEAGSTRPSRPGDGRAPPAGRPALAASEAIAIDAPDPDASGLADELRSLVGVRDGQATHVSFALDVLAHMGVSLDGELYRLERGKELVDIARRRGALGDDPPLLGDLVVFDDVRDGEPASLIGVVVASDRHGTVELIHLSRGIVRRSFVNRHHPFRARDGDGRAQNTFIRPGRPGDSSDTRYLAGELFATFIRLDRLAD